jgi:hypothetical protein
MKLITRIWFWLLAIPLLLLGSLSLSFGIFATIDKTLGPTSLNVWGDMEGLVVAVWIGAAVAFALGLVALIALLVRASRNAGSV